MKKLNLFVVLLISVVFFFTIVACTPSPDPAPGGGGAAEEAETPAETPAEDPAPVVANDDIVVVAWEMYGPQRNMDGLVAEFNAIDNGIYVDQEFLPGHAELIQRLMVVAAAESDIPDAVLVDMFYAPFIDELVGNVDLRPFIDADPTLDYYDFYVSLREFSVVDGRQISIHAYANNLILYYNRAHFIEAGLDPYSPPRSWDDLVTYAQALTGDGQIGFHSHGFEATYYEGLSWVFQTFLWQNGGEVWDSNWQATFNSPQGIGALQFMVDLVHHYQVATTAPPAEGFQQGLISMFKEGTWMAQAFREALGDDLMAAPLPYNVTPATNIGGEHWQIIQSTPEQEAAMWEYISFMLSEHAVMEIISNGGQVPTRRSISEGEAFLSFIADCPGTTASMQSMEFGRMRATSSRYAAASEAKFHYLERAMFAVISVEEALAGAEVAWQNAIND